MYMFDGYGSTVLQHCTGMGVMSLQGMHAPRCACGSRKPCCQPPACSEKVSHVDSLPLCHLPPL